MPTAHKITAFAWSAVLLLLLYVSAERDSGHIAAYLAEIARYTLAY